MNKNAIFFSFKKVIIFYIAEQIDGLLKKCNCYFEWLHHKDLQHLQLIWLWLILSRPIYRLENVIILHEFCIVELPSSITQMVNSIKMCVYLIRWIYITKRALVLVFFFSSVWVFKPQIFPYSVIKVTILWPR